MSLVIVALTAGLVAGLLLGGSPRNLTGARLRAIGLLLAGAGCEILTRWVGGVAGPAILVVGYLLLIGFAWRNVATTGMVLVAIGLLANLTVITVNRGMPVRGLPPGTTYGWRHHGERPGDHLTGLADVVPLTPLGETVSAGDIVLSLGVATVAVTLMRPSRRPAPPRAKSAT
jgi:Family of unknown function (DUF5317)